MAADNSFDIVSKIDMQELNNAIQQADLLIAEWFDIRELSFQSPALVYQQVWPRYSEAAVEAYSGRPV